MNDDTVDKFFSDSESDEDIVPLSDLVPLSDEELLGL